MKIIMKFGGSSIADGKCINQVAKIVADYTRRKHQVTVIISALQGVTDQLSKAAEEARVGNLEYTQEFVRELEERHFDVAKRAIRRRELREGVLKFLRTTFSELGKVLTGISYLGELSPKSLDYVLSFGERLSTPIVCDALRDARLDARCLTGKEVGIVTDSSYGEARPLMNITSYRIKRKLEPLLEEGATPVVPGYIATSQDGSTTTLGRGGSDYSATIIGAALKADEVWIWTDVDGLMTADPKAVSSARTIPWLSFQEAMEMAVFGTKALHPRALEPAMEERIPVRVKNTFNPLSEGTLIVRERKVKKGDVVKAVTLIKGVSLVNVSGAGMVGAPGTAARVFDLLGKNDINVLMISQSASEANISFIIKRSLLGKAISALEIGLLGQGIMREVVTEENVSVVAAVGAGMKGTPGVAARLFSAVARKGINIIMISQGSSEVNISFAVKEEDGGRAVRAIHDEFGLER